MGKRKKKKRGITFYPEAWFGEPGLQNVGLSIKGAWLEILLCMIDSHPKGELQITPVALTQKWGVTQDAVCHIIKQLDSNNIASIIFPTQELRDHIYTVAEAYNPDTAQCHANVTLMSHRIIIRNRRIYREERTREFERLRKRRQREKKKTVQCHANVPPNVTLSTSVPPNVTPMSHQKSVSQPIDFEVNPENFENCHANVPPNVTQLSRIYNNISVYNKDICSIGNEKPPDKYKPESEEIKLADILYQAILQRNPKFKKPNMQKWAHDVDLLIRVDKQNTNEIRSVILWCQKDDFWQDNILSTKKLRKHYDRLYLKMKKGNGGTYGKTTGYYRKPQTNERSRLDEEIDKAIAESEARLLASRSKTGGKPGKDA